MSVFIHNFIKRMTMREKAYFKRFAKLYSEKTDKNYLQLFEVVDKMEYFDKRILKKHFEGQSIAKHLSSELNYLLKQLLKSMANFYLESTMPMKLQQAILYIEILIERGFQKKAQKFLNKAKKLAYQYEDFTTILKLIQLEEEILFRQGILGFTENLVVLEKERELITAKINNFNQLRLLREQIRELQLSIYDKESQKAMKTYCEHQLIKNENSAKSIRAKEHWFYNKAVLYSFVKNNKQTISIYETGIDFLMQHNFIFKPEKVLVFMSNYLLACCRLKDSALFFKMYDRLLTYQANQKLHIVYIDFVKYARILELYYQIEDDKAAMEMIPIVADFLQQHFNDLEILQKSYLYMILVRACVQSNQYEIGLQHLNDIIQKGIREPRILRGRLFLLMIYMRLDWLELARSEIESTYKILVRHKMYNELSKTFLKHWKAYIQYPNRRKQNLKKLGDKLEQISGLPEFKIEFDFFDYAKWVRNMQMLMDS